MFNQMTIIAVAASFFVASAAVNAQPVGLDNDRTEKANRDAGRLLKEALNAQAAWWNFPGFHAEIAVQSEGRNRTGRVIVEPDGRIHIEHLDPLAAQIARTHLSDLVCHLLCKQSRNKPAMSFVNTDSHPLLGKAVLRVSNGFEATRWIKDKKIQMTEQCHKDRKQINQFADHEKNQDGAFLPKIKVISNWNSGANKIDNITTVLVTWNRAGRFDVPKEIRVIAIDGKGQGAVVSNITISNVILEERTPLSLASKKQ